MTTAKKVHAVKRIAVIVPETEKSRLIEWAYANKHSLAQHELFAIGIPARILEGVVNKEVNRLASNTFDGMRKLSSMIEKDKIDIIIFLEEQISDEILKSNLLRNAINGNVVVATNITTANFVVDSLTKQNVDSQGNINEELSDVA